MAGSRNKRIGANQKVLLSEKRKEKKKILVSSIRHITKVTLIVVILSMIVGSSVYALTRFNIKEKLVKKFEYTNVIVHGNVNYSEKEILAMAGIYGDNYSGQKSIKSIESAVSNNRCFKSVKVKRKLPGTLDIIVQERKAIALVNHGEISLVDRYGVLWNGKLGEFYDLPVISNVEVDDSLGIVKEKDIKKIRNIISVVSSYCEKGYENISQIVFYDSGSIKLYLESSSIVLNLKYENLNRDYERAWRIVESEVGLHNRKVKKIMLDYNNIAFIN